MTVKQIFTTAPSRKIQQGCNFILLGLLNMVKCSIENVKLIGWRVWPQLHTSIQQVFLDGEALGLIVPWENLWDTL